MSVHHLFSYRFECDQCSTLSSVVHALTFGEAVGLVLQNDGFVVLPIPGWKWGHPAFTTDKVTVACAQHAGDPRGDDPEDKSKAGELAWDQAI